ncbi:methyltransferase family protein [Bradyrhizobium elkanii]|uniref:Protein-S-isoprenylcysteine O-methyltransferase Ste14 n=1 Tax=Bradyrhizobium elkanii TaxID=29448 RepID=A0ABV4FAI9_BRAEL|nr:isoprenylcysteine carboxylmethyltransferase family protein [Bradyrhizobium elkanii]MCP1752029.1 protein-S-isoprenylcysteine O-methyltransferase Ste14 [Bradyrhizobium elkanii]MCP1977800.1 protein-S-isoprenylcysteine O-methyltransferase Ste14 [Bradyrhizobium elkanii]MCS3887682.1 protein-S-isoprenylcysteine O-methyltransferase Ste14 [Bradyrhizobium elkanii]MCS4213299.1 protein-S-isoprenylcysteine O-methyltransferase Ste14 [Bradyrhizobium elkanii]MCW2213605.1 protein-S-isoprenylcysteine O-methy
MTDVHWRLLIVTAIALTTSIRAFQDPHRDSLRKKYQHWTTEYLCVILAFVALVQLVGLEILPMDLGPRASMIVRGSGVATAIFASIGMTWPWFLRKHSWGGPLTLPDDIPGHFLATSGPYRYVRHPVYASMILGFVAIELAVASCLVFVIAPLFTIHAIVVAKQEECDLEATYGDEFRAYKERSWRLVPFVY